MEVIAEKWIFVLKSWGLIASGSDSCRQFVKGVLLRWFFVYAMLILQLIYLKEIKDLLDFTTLMSTLCTYISFTVKFLNISFQTKAIDELIDAIKTELSDYQLDEKFERRIATCKRIFYSLATAAFVTTFFGGFVPFFTHELAYRMWFPYDLSNPYLFWMSVIYQHISTVFGSWLDAILEMLPVFFMAYIVAMLEQLNDELQKLGKCNEKVKREAWQKDVGNNEYRSKMIKIINKHRALIEITRKLEKIFNLTFFVRGLASMIVFCSSAFSLITVESTSVAIRLITFIIPTFAQLLIPCYYGNEITFQSDRLLISLFHSEWYEEHYQKDIIILMEFSKKKIKISTLKILQIDLATFMRVCNSAYSLYAVFKNIYHKN